MYNNLSKHTIINFRIHSKFLCNFEYTIVTWNICFIPVICLEDYSNSYIMDICLEYFLRLESLWMFCKWHAVNMNMFTRLISKRLPELEKLNI